MGENYNRAIEEADRIEKLIIDTLKSGKSFRVEAGAGAGKTHSLNNVVEWIQHNKWEEFKSKKQKVACITYTNAAVDVINERLKADTFIVPSTIHSFAWNLINRYQKALLEIILVKSLSGFSKEDLECVSAIKYDLGVSMIKDNVLYLHHDEVIELFAFMLEKDKFRRIFTSQFPIILIDEYQDSFKIIIDKFIEYFISKNIGPQFAFFGDSWQTIYQSNNVCGIIEHDNVEEIQKISNFRSAPKIVDTLNRIRPELCQISAEDNFSGEVIVITNNDFPDAQRRRDFYYKGDLPDDEIQHRHKILRDKLLEQYSEEEFKSLMITHKVLAKAQGYDELLNILDDGLKQKDDQVLLFFMDMVEPLFDALEKSDAKKLFDVLGGKRAPINNKSEKEKWHKLYNDLSIMRKERAIDVLDVVVASQIVPIPSKVRELYKTYYSNPWEIYRNTSVDYFLELGYIQFINAINFLSPGSAYSTEHGVKGREYDNVIFVISKGWAQYQFEKYMPMSGKDIKNEKTKEAFIKNRNLFYVCCSRSRKRLIIFITVPVDEEFHNYLCNIAGEENIFTFTEFCGDSIEE